MKGLSLTLSIVIIAIVLLVTALVIMTIFGTQISSVMNTLGIWSTDTLKVNLCQQKCATWCQLNPTESGPSGGSWGGMTVQTDDGKTWNCDVEMPKAGKEKCICGVIGIGQK